MKRSLDLTLESMKTNGKIERLPNKSIKEIQRSNKELADLKRECLMKRKSRMKKLSV